MKTIIEKAKAYDEALERARALNNGKDIDVEAGTTTCEYIFPELKEPKENNDKKIRKAIIDLVLNNIGEGILDHNNVDCYDMLAWLEKQGEQKFADKVQPKFKVGDWILYSGDNYEAVRCITKIDEKGYYVEINGLPHGIIPYIIPYNHEICMRLWTISDARDGDVLVCNINKAEIGGDIEKLPNITPTICIYQNVEKDQDYIHSYCSLYNESSLVLQNRMYYNAFVYNIHPATKEQCDLLFHKMKEAGLEWNSVTKEPKRITKFKVGDKVHCGDETQLVTIIGITNDSYTTDSMIGPIPFSEEDNWTLIKNKFNVGDWIVFNGLILHIDEVVNGYYRTTSIGDGIHNSYDWDIDNIARLWNISDARCGDVLISSLYKQPFVYNGHYTCDSLGAYFGLNYRGELSIGDNYDNHNNNWTRLIGVQPATEEQRNMLFNKLHDSDYKWDSEKKELWHKIFIN